MPPHTSPQLSQDAPPSKMNFAEKEYTLVIIPYRWTDFGVPGTPLWACNVGRATHHYIYIQESKIIIIYNNIYSLVLLQRKMDGQ